MNRPEHLAALERSPNVRISTVDGPGIDIGYARPDDCVAEVKMFLRELGLVAD